MTFIIIIKTLFTQGVQFIHHFSHREKLTLNIYTNMQTRDYYWITSYNKYSTYDYIR